MIGPLQPQLTLYDAATGNYQGPRDGAWANLCAHLHDIFSVVKFAEKQARSGPLKE